MLLTFYETTMLKHLQILFEAAKPKAKTDGFVFAL